MKNLCLTKLETEVSHNLPLSSSFQIRCACECGIPKLFFSLSQQEWRSSRAPAGDGALLDLVRRTIPNADLYAAAAPTADHTSSHHQYVTPAAAAARRRAALVAAAREAASRAV